MSAAWKGHDCILMYMFGCLVNGVCMYGLAVVLAFLEHYRRLLESI